MSCMAQPIDCPNGQSDHVCVSKHIDRHFDDDTKHDHHHLSRYYLASALEMLRAFSIFHAWTIGIIQTAWAVYHVFSNRSIKSRLLDRIWNLSTYNSIYKVTIVDFIFQPKKNVSMRKTTLLKLNSTTKCNCLLQYILLCDFVHQRS